jgi:hypothetical protein
LLAIEARAREEHWRSLVVGVLPPGDPNEAEDEADEDREPAIIREPDKDE